jgi:hypothetical protein
LLQEDEHMTIKSKLATLFAAGMLASTVAAHAQGAMAPDPNVAPSTSGEEAEIPGTTANSLELAAAPDPNVGPSTSGEEAELPGTTANSPQLAAAPDPNLGLSTAEEEAAIQSGVLSARASAPSDTPEAIQQ